MKYCVTYRIPAYGSCEIEAMSIEEAKTIFHEGDYVDYPENLGFSEAEVVDVEPVNGQISLLDLLDWLEQK